MPLFMALSGALFFHNTKKYLPFLQGKVMRLLIPFFIVSIFYSIPIKFVSGYWTNSNNVIYDIVVGQLLLQGNSHLWFLLTLFFCFLLLYPIQKNFFRLSKYQLLFITLVLLVINYCSRYFLEVRVLNKIMNNLLWMYWGMLFESKRISLSKKINVNKMTVTLILFGLTKIVFYIMKRYVKSYCFFEYFEWGVSLVIAVLGSISVYSISFLLSHTYISNTRFVKTLCNWSFGIYLFSDPINYLVLWMVSILVSRYSISTIYLYEIVFSVRLLLTYILALLITKTLKKLKIGFLF